MKIEEIWSILQTLADLFLWHFLVVLRIQEDVKASSCTVTIIDAGEVEAGWGRTLTSSVKISLFSTHLLVIQR